MPRRRTTTTRTTTTSFREDVDSSDDSDDDDDDTVGSRRRRQQQHQQQQQQQHQLHIATLERRPSLTRIVERLMEEGAVPKPQSFRATAIPPSQRDDGGLIRYNHYRLAQSLIRHEKRRLRSLRKEGKAQIQYVQSNDGWIATLFITRGRALDILGLPFYFAVAHAALYVCMRQYMIYRTEEEDQEYNNNNNANNDNTNNDNGDSSILFRRESRLATWELFYTLVLNTTMSSLLILRLQRAQDHFWEAREMWDYILTKTRSFVGGLVTYANTNDHTNNNHHPNTILESRDDAIRWVAAFALSTMELLRGTDELPRDHFAGILSMYEIHTLADNSHPPLYAAHMVRMALKNTFRVTSSTPLSIAQAYVRHYDYLEEQLDLMIKSCTKLQMIRSTPLPIAYVSLLRTLLMMCIIILPYIWGPYWTWRTIPIVAIAAYAWFGTEAASTEIECPFHVHRVNALNMNGFCIGLLQTIQQQVVNHADRDIEYQELQQQQQQQQAEAAQAAAAAAEHERLKQKMYEQQAYYNDDDDDNYYHDNNYQYNNNNNNPNHINNNSNDPNYNNNNNNNYEGNYDDDDDDSEGALEW